MSDEKKYEPELTDLRRITSDSDRCVTTVTLYMDPPYNDKKIQWLIFGRADIRRFDNRNETWLSAYLDNATDPEHDSAFALRLPLVGLKLGRFPVLSGMVFLTAWVQPHLTASDSPDFRVPRPGYHPVAKGTKCTSKDCRGAAGHFLVEEGLYLPPFDAKLYEAVRGHEVEIRIGPAEKPERPSRARSSKHK